MGKVEFLKMAGLKQSGQRGAPVIQRQAEVESEECVSQPDPCPQCGVEVGWGSLPARKSPLALLLRYGYYRRCPMCKKETEVQI